ncbi:retinal maintenance-domain-containing protein [Obelidium mucronatum]|nr:retinal maintenance-domain-containing protein [Obelidium mucronatum]
MDRDSSDLDAILLELSDSDPFPSSTKKKEGNLNAYPKSCLDKTNNNRAASNTSRDKNYNIQTKNPQPHQHRHHHNQSSKTVGSEDLDSIESLLDSLDDGIGATAATAKEAQKHQPKNSHIANSKAIDDSDVDDILNDDPVQLQTVSHGGTNSCITVPKQKCPVPHVTSNSSTTTSSTSTLHDIPTACNKLRCLSCDLPVIVLSASSLNRTVTPNKKNSLTTYSKSKCAGGGGGGGGGGVEWTDQVDYLFLRNFYPDVSKLGDRLLSTEYPSQAYCCQCAWVNVHDTLVPVRSIQKEKIGTKWVCRGH